MPLIEIARTKTKDEAMAALDTWRGRYPAVGRPAAAGGRTGRRHARAKLDLVPDPDQPAARAGDQRPPQEELIADYSPWKGRTPILGARKKGKRRKRRKRDRGKKTKREEE